jgi:TM2 domain-containing membrane protein YozV
MMKTTLIGLRGTSVWLSLLQDRCKIIYEIISILKLWKIASLSNFLNPHNRKVAPVLKNSLASHFPHNLSFATVLLLFLLCGKVSAQLNTFYQENELEMILNSISDLEYFGEETEETVRENRKLVAVGLAILLGPFGGHRIYLGTKPHVPVIYTLTMGGGFFILPLVDIILILVNKDLSKYEDNHKVIMW